VSPVAEPTCAYLLWRDPVRGKHHVSEDATMALCGQPIWGFWETQGATRWADEDGCKHCTRSAANGGEAVRDA
jgi:predicted chitinase